MVSAIVWRIPLHGTVRSTFKPSMTWFIAGSVVSNEGKVYPIVILIKLAISVNVQENLDLFLRMTLDISLGKHRIQHGQVGGMGRETGGVGDGSDMMVEIRNNVRVIT